MKSTHRVDVTRILEIQPHPNADALEIAKVFGFTCCVAKGQFRAGDLAAYIQPDSLVDVSRPEFAFLANQAKDGLVRIRVRKLRGVHSQGLLLPARKEWLEGQDVAEILGVMHYEPPFDIRTGGETAKPPMVTAPTYTDIANLRRYLDVLVHDEMVIIMEKVHGTSGRYVHDGERLHAGSHREWKVRAPDSAWWQAAEGCELEEKLQAHPGLVLYGEVYGWIQSLRYGASRGERPRIAFFDAMSEGRFLDFVDFHKVLFDLDLPIVPLLYVGGWDPKLIVQAEGQSLVARAEHIREGFVVRPELERWDERIGRVILKCVGNGYLES